MELGIVPYVLIRIGVEVDHLVGWPSLLPSKDSVLVSAVFFLIGIPWLGSSIYIQHRLGRGTPLPLVPTKKLLVEGPYRYTRNPMALGAIFWLGGWAAMANSRAAMVGGTAVFAAILFSYHKLVEEKELRARFGEAFDAYRRTTPFLIPKIKMGTK